MKKFFILSAGRTGSSLLAACMADAGANFGMAEGDWDRNAGAMEHPGIHAVVDPYLRAMSWSENTPPMGCGKFQWKRWRKQSKQVAKSLFGTVDYFKLPGIADVLAEIALRHGYEVVPIINTRPFAETVNGMMANNDIPFRQLADVYCRTYENALVWLHRFGGCVVDYTDLMSESAVTWAKDIEAVTGLDARTILDARSKRMKPARNSDAFPLSDPRAVVIYETITNSRRADRSSNAYRSQARAR